MTEDQEVEVDIIWQYWAYMTREWLDCTKDFPKEHSDKIRQTARIVHTTPLPGGQAEEEETIDQAMRRLYDEQLRTKLPRDKYDDAVQNGYEAGFYLGVEWSRSSKK